MKSNPVLLLIAFLMSGQFAFAQLRPVDQVNQEFKDKVSELTFKYRQDGFVTYKAGNLDMEKNTEFPIFVELQQGRWYQFLVVGDPEATKLEMKLGLEGVGDFITDKFKIENVQEHWTQFSFVCPRSGRYLLTFYQKGPKKDMLGHVAIMQKPRHNTEGAAKTYSLR